MNFLQQPSHIFTEDLHGSYTFCLLFDEMKSNNIIYHREHIEKQNYS